MQKIGVARLVSEIRPIVNPNEQLSRNPIHLGQQDDPLAQYGLNQFLIKVVNL